MTSKPPELATGPGPVLDPECDDQALIFRLISRDELALDLLMRKYWSPILAVGLRVLQRRSEAEEVAQDVFWALWRFPERFDAARGPLLTWLVIVARSRALDRLRRTQASRESELTAGALSNEPSFVQRSSRDQELVIDELVRRLPSEQGWVVHKAYFEGYALREIALIRGVPLGTIKGRARFAIKKLRSELDAAS